ncbi:hypothetical protein CYLTODRAFT_424647 [Cylindrobasidium torrendii FP15055 ss-10]|uniref:Protein kinase domain-containing protein n=1 Tax=Cylindrobasidium torrendii FP15055 ss-10 TaxID=1314674 RepID=A0A0D7B4D2_9AGAR|nr:hypothetical protein CYLTODRAFT_424647 [Cylindrobasidium torrendii FP15055 ss-10]
MNVRPVLLEAGYRLPANYDLTWQPKSRAERKAVEATMPRWSLVGLVRSVDNVQVMAKHVQGREEETVRYLATLPENPRNHCTPILDIISTPDSEVGSILIMPLFLSAHQPLFETVGELLEFFRQIFEGVHFMHEHRLAHGDCILENFAMSSKEMYPHGFFPYYPNKSRSFRRNISPHGTRTWSWPRYYIIDFGRSCHFPLEQSEPARNERVLAERTPGRNPFPHDVHYLGQVLKKRFLEDDTLIAENVDFLWPLATDMLHETSSLRPTIDEVVLRFHRIVAHIPSSRLRRPVYRFHVLFRFPHTFARVSNLLLFRAPMPRKTPSPVSVIPESARDFYTQAATSEDEDDNHENKQARILLRTPLDQLPWARPLTIEEQFERAFASIQKNQPLPTDEEVERWRAEYC